MEAKVICGIAGFLGHVGTPLSCLSAMISAIAYRGPDDQRFWTDGSVGLGLAHARLSILDLSPTGRQPMVSQSSRYVLVFNGEIYNHHALRNELITLGVRKWIGHSDTETLLAAIEQWGLNAALKRATGMFAFVMWDKKEQKLFLVRDRMGEKPLYYGWVDDVFVFASELKAIKSLDIFNNPVDRSSLALFLRFNSIPAPYSIYKGIYKLEPGCVLDISVESKEINQTRYWSTESKFEKETKTSFCTSEKVSVDHLENLLLKTIDEQMHADVSVGAFLSGGVDSSTIVSLMQSISSNQISTFSIGFDSSEFNEAEYAKAVASHLGTSHFEAYVTDRDALNVIPMLPDIYDEPFSDSSQIPTYLVSKIAKEKVSVALSGDGADELFGGYNRYLFANRFFNKFSYLPNPCRVLLSKAILTLSEERWNMLLGGALGNKFANVGSKLHKGANVFTSDTIRTLHFDLASQIQSPCDWLINATEYTTLFDDGIDHFQKLNPIEQMMAYDLMVYLPTDILAKVDRASMAVSLETRTPFLDPAVIEFSATLPLDYKIRNGITKWILREVLSRYVPKRLIERPKVGFGVPLAEWLRGPLRDWAENLLDPRQLHVDGYFNATFIRKKWHEHLTGKRNWSHQLWSVLMFQAWLLKNQ